MHTDNAKVETLSERKYFIRKQWIKVTVTEPCSPNQNKCKHEFGFVHIHVRMLMEQTQCPEQLWDDVIEYVCYMRNRMAWKALGDITPLEALSGDTPDISEIFDFEFRELVRYFENPEIKFPKPKWM